MTPGAYVNVCLRLEILSVESNSDPAEQTNGVANKRLESAKVKELVRSSPDRSTRRSTKLAGNIPG